MIAVDFAVGPSYEVVIVGDSRTKDTREMLQAIGQDFIPSKVVIFIPLERDSSEIKGIAPFATHQLSIDNRATAYVCVNYNCRLPTTDINAMLSLLNPS